MSRAIDLSEAELAIVRAILRSHLPAEARAWVFGSRATATARRYSDLDLAFESDKTIDSDVLGQITEALTESDLPYTVDVIDLKAVDPSFRALIETDMIALPF